jgi:hypothetical protein
MTEFEFDRAEGISAPRSIDPMVSETYKPREDHRGPDTIHIGQSHIEKDRLERAAKAINQGPTFDFPGTPPSADNANPIEIEQASEDLDGEANVARSG